MFGDNVKVVSSTSITFTTPAFSVGAADVEVRNPDNGTATDPSALTYTLGTGPINYIQRADAATGSAASTVPTSPMANPQTKGNTNIIVIGWGDVLSQVASVTDTEGNTYQAALPTVNGSDTSQTIYYAKNIKGDNPSCAPTCNTITVTFNRGAKSPDVRALEYSGLDPNNPLDTGASNSGSGTTADTLVCSTTSASEVIVAGATVDSFERPPAPVTRLLITLSTAITLSSRLRRQLAAAKQRLSCRKLGDTVGCLQGWSCGGRQLTALLPTRQPVRR